MKLEALIWTLIVIIGYMAAADDGTNLHVEKRPTQAIPNRNSSVARRRLAQSKGRPSKSVALSYRRRARSRIPKSCGGESATQALENWQDFSDAVFTGIVQHIDRLEGHLEVVIKRVLKAKPSMQKYGLVEAQQQQGSSAIKEQRLAHKLNLLKPSGASASEDLLTNEITDSSTAFTTNALNPVPKSVGSGSKSLLRLQGLYEAKLTCVTTFRIRPKDTLLFMVAKVDGSSLQLTSAPLRITLRNLRLIHTKPSINALPDVPYQPRSPVVEEPCEATHCAYGASCITDEEGKATCRCIETCPAADNPTTRVCGTDNVTYSSECFLKKWACEYNQQLRIKNLGECEIPDPCLSLQCQPGAKCIPSQDGRTAICQCATRCPNYGDSAGSRPLCGADAKDYANMCELHRASCLSNRQIEIKFQGLCDPCGNVTCPADQVCQLDEERKAHCRCGGSCPPEFQPVCGSDGRTYSNECMLTKEACRGQKGLRILYRGQCSSGINPCATAACKPGEECQINKFGIARCVCPGPCAPILRPVCGTDRKTYDNECELKRHACLNQSDMTLAYVGTCGSSVCTYHECPPGGYCVEVSGQPTCECSSCGGEFDPVCGSDGVSYTNPCRLRLESCRTRKTISVLYKGLCNFLGDVSQTDGCESKQCDFYATCESDGMGTARCVCPRGCMDQPETKVCGTDGMTYRNECELKAAACRKHQFIVIASTGDCDLCKNVRCKWGARCEDGVCVCPTNCPSNPSPSLEVCGSDGRSYASECEVEKKACELKTSLQVMHNGPCQPLLGADYINPWHGNHTYVNCKQSPYGCCPDEKTPAPGPRGAGCPSTCNCNKLGSVTDTCDPVTFQCQCKFGVGGRYCDRCEPGYWGLHKNMEGADGCTLCACNSLGSARTDCEQMSGRCVCRPHVVGHKCDRCQDGRPIDQAPGGCALATLSAFGSPSCQDMKCLYGAECQEIRGGQTDCICKMDCESDPPPDEMVCGTNGQSYASECELRLDSCRRQMEIMVASFGPCIEDGATSPPLSHAELRVTESQGNGQSYSKSTRHVLPLSKDLAMLDLSLDSNQNRDLNQVGVSYHGWRPTPATVHVKGFLGDICVADTDCTIPNAVCTRSFCSCAEGFVESENSRFCIRNQPVVDTDMEQSSCSSHPCMGDSTCEPLGEESYVCHCGPERTGPQCEHRLNDEDWEGAETPSFHGRSYVMLRRIKAHVKLHIELEFKATTESGLLLYAQQRDDGTGDFFALALVDRYVEFRYNLGNGVVILRSAEPVSLHEWHKVLAQRYRQDGLLSIDHGEHVAGKSPGHLRALDLESNTWMGYIPNAPIRVYDNIGTQAGFVGCIRRVKLGRKLLTFQLPDPNKRSSGNQAKYLGEEQVPKNGLVLKTEAVTRCGDNPCRRQPCMHGSTCVHTNDNNYSCMCSPGYTGANCEAVADPCLKSPCAHGSTCVNIKGRFECKCPWGKKGTTCMEYDSEQEVLVPEFSITSASSTSYIALPTLENVAHSLNLEIWFLTRSSEGTLLYAAQSDIGRGNDFIWLGLQNGRMRFVWDLGSGLGNISVAERVTLHQWHKVIVSRKGKEASLQLNDGVPVYGNSLGPLTELSLETHTLLGGWKYGITPAVEELALQFQGAVQRVVINGEINDRLMESMLEMKSVTAYKGPPCGDVPSLYTNKGTSSSRGICQNGGVCQPILGHFTCKCMAGYGGKRCEKRLDDGLKNRAVRFNGYTFLKYPNQVKDVLSPYLSYAWETHLNLTDLDIFHVSSTNISELYEEDTNEELELDGEHEAVESSSTENNPFQSKSQRTNRFELRLRATAQDGLILWSSRGHTLQADYLALALVHGKLELSFNLGKQTKFLAARSTVDISDGRWHTVVTERRKRLAYIQVDNEAPVKVTADHGATVLNTNGKLWIGGSSHLPDGLPSSYYEGFRGCIATVKVDKHELSLTRHSENTLEHFCDAE